MKDDEGWKMNDEGWWFQAVEGFCRRTDGQTFAIVESLSRLKITYKISWSKCIYLIQTFGHKYGGTIYGFLFTSDIVNNLLVGALSRTVLAAGGWTGFFLCLASFGLLAFLITCFFPANPEPGPRPQKTVSEVEAAFIEDTLDNDNDDDGYEQESLSSWSKSITSQTVKSSWLHFQWKCSYNLS